MKTGSKHVSGRTPLLLVLGLVLMLMAAACTPAGEPAADTQTTDEAEESAAEGEAEPTEAEAEPEAAETEEAAEVDQSVIDSYPPSSVNYIIPFDPGGESDIHARLQQQALEGVLGASVVIDYMPGGGGALGWSELLRMEPDGATFMGHNLPHIILQPLLREDAGYETEELQPVYIFQSTPNVLMVREDSPFQTAEELIEAAREAPGAITIGGSGEFTANHLAVLIMDNQAEVETTYVPFTGTGAAVPALLGGHVSALMSFAPQAVSIEGTRTLAVSTAERFPGLPDVPTFSEVGIDLVDGAYRGVSVPPGTPQPIIDRLAEAFADVNADPDVLAQMLELGFNVEDYDPEESRALVAERTAVYVELLTELGLLE